MNIVLDLEDYNVNNIFFQNPIKNNVMENSEFIRIIYSNENFSLNGMYLKLNINISGVERYFNKYKYSFNIGKNTNIINKLISIEKSILQHAQLKNKIPSYRLAEQLHSGNMRFFTTQPHTNNTTTFIIKISGIWKSMREQGEYGLTYKLIEAVPQSNVQS